MSAGASTVMNRAAELRREFDRAFVEPFQLGQAQMEDFLAIRIGTEASAIRLSEISRLFADKKITRVPGGHAALRGIAGFRGTMLPVYDLPMLMGRGASPAPRWMVIGKAEPVALAFDGFERQLRAPPEAIMPQSARTGGQSCARDYLRTADFSGPIIDLASVLDVIRTLRAGSAHQEE
jgi:purine-binding chemotaxis protein CheW